MCRVCARSHTSGTCWHSDAAGSYRCTRYLTLSARPSYVDVGIATVCDARRSGARQIPLCDLRVCSSVCPSARISQKPHVQASRNSVYMLPVSVAGSSSDENAISYVLPVLSIFAFIGRLVSLAAGNAFVYCGHCGGISTVRLHSASGTRVHWSPRGVTGAKSAVAECHVCFQEMKRSESEWF